MIDDVFNLLGAEEPPKPARLTLSNGVFSLVAGVAGAWIFRRSHPVLGYLGVSALASNIHAAANGERTWRQAGRRIGRHAIATAGALTLPKHPIIGYVAGAFAAEMVIDDDGTGVLEEWVHHIKGDDKREVIDGTVVEVKPAQMALVKQS